MAEVSWSDEALSKIEGIVTYIAQSNPQAGNQLGQDLLDAGESLATFPNRRRRAPGGRRELVTVWPYIIVYSVAGANVRIRNIHHGAQRRPQT
jgi:plasmid stabilization system protein ParE